MAQKHRYNNNRKLNAPAGRPRRDAPVREATVRPEPKPPVQYGKPFVLLEDANLNTFEYVAGAWIPYGLTIAQCRQKCQVKELAQKVSGKTRYEVRSPIPSAN
jgi:hypothetical protein